ncbi:hypothetical protein ACMHYB_00795 [Sorangium sp. So ce1128]
MVQPTSPPLSGGFKPEPIARAELHHFVHDFDPRTDSLPKRIDPLLVERFLREELAAGGRPPPDHAAQMAALANFYDVRGIVPDILKLLDRGERTDDELVASTVLTGVVGILGEGAAWDAGRGYYHYLLSLPFAERRMNDLLSAYACYAPKETPGITKGRMDELITSFSAREQMDPAAGPARRAMENLRNVTMPRIEAGIALETEILAAADLAARLDRIVGIYLGLDERYNEIIGPWAVRQLIRAGRTGQGAEIVAAIRRTLPSLVGKPAAEVWKARALHAIDFFGGALTPEEARDVRPEYKRYDLLSND